LDAGDTLEQLHTPRLKERAIGMKMKRLIVSFFMVSILIIGASNPLQAAPTCDRQCLVALMQDYLAALVKHDPKAVPFADEVKFTENTANIPVGEGLWVTASGGPIYDIEATGLVFPYGTKTGWE
jgi:hypothetical protein